MTDYTITNLVLNDEVFDSDEFKEKFYPFLRTFGKSDFVTPQYSETSAQTIEVFASKDEETTIALWEDYLRRVRYFEITSKDFEFSNLISEKLRGTFKVVDPQKLILKLGEKEINEDEREYFKLAFAAPETFTQTIFDFFETLIHSSEEKKQEIGVKCAGILGWQEFYDILPINTGGDHGNRMDQGLRRRECGDRQ